MGSWPGGSGREFFLRSGPTPGSWDRSSCWRSLEPIFRVFQYFGSGHVSETGFYVVYLLNMVFLAASFFASVTIAGSVAKELMEFMRVLLPAYFLAVAMAGGAFTSTAVCGFTFGAIGVVQAVVSGVLPSSDAGLYDAGVSREPLQGGHDFQDHRALRQGICGP